MVWAQFQLSTGLMLLGLWLGVRSLPISVEPPRETLEPQQKVSHPMGSELSGAHLDQTGPGLVLGSGSE